MTQESSTQTPPLATIALGLTIPDWKNIADTPETAATSDIEVLTERVTALLLVRCVAVAAPLGRFPDLSTSNICRTALMKKQAWPSKITRKVIDQLREFVRRMLKGYKDCPYHNREHAFHVVLSVNKLMDMLLQEKKTKAFGLRNDGLALMAVLFAALIHDVEHQGIPNRQLASEDDRLAVLYNDQSIAENWSLYVGFSEFLQDDFKDLRAALFPNGDDYRRFRKMVINLVLTTDIASPERTQLAKSKWKEAFGDPFETIERKVRADSRRRLSITGREVQVRGDRRASRRGTGDVSEVSFDALLASQMHGSGNRSSFPGEPVSSRTLEEDGDSLSNTPEHSENGDAPDNDNGEPLPPLVAHLSRTSSKFERRLSASSRNTSTSKYRYRLGILRTVDLSGETLETYSRSGSIGQSIKSGDHSGYPIDFENDEADELKATVVMETLMAAADVAHNLQGWDPMVKWAGRLYLELRRAYADNRGSDPEQRWFENQIGFLESYLLPLARRLEDTGVFNEVTGQQFAMIVEDNRDRWLTEGYDETQAIVEQGAQEYPIAE